MIKQKPQETFNYFDTFKQPKNVQIFSPYLEKYFTEDNLQKNSHSPQQRVFTNPKIKQPNYL